MIGTSSSSCVTSIHSTDALSELRGCWRNIAISLIEQLSSQPTKNAVSFRQCCSESTRTSSPVFPLPHSGGCPSIGEASCCEVCQSNSEKDQGKGEWSSPYRDRAQGSMDGCFAASHDSQTLLRRALAKERLDLILEGVLVHHPCV